MQIRDGIPLDFEPAAACWTVLSEGGDDNVAILFGETAHTVDVASSVILFGEEMEQGSIVPDVEAFELQVGS
jgi:hypothetical protein